MAPIADSSFASFDLYNSNTDDIRSGVLSALTCSGSEPKKR